MMPAPMCDQCLRTQKDGAQKQALCPHPPKPLPRDASLPSLASVPSLVGWSSPTLGGGSREFHLIPDTRGSEEDTRNAN